MQETVRSVRNRIKNELGKLWFETCYKITFGSITIEEIKQHSLSYRSTITKWEECKRNCENPFHKLPARKRRRKVCPDCGIKYFEHLLEPLDEE